MRLSNIFPCFVESRVFDIVFSVVYMVFFKQKTAYEMRISDWSSDVCSSDLRRQLAPHDARALTEDPNPPANPACEPYPLTGENSAEPAPPIDIAHRSAQTPVL